jgi:tetratricopeptide (TPR) repeat protein
MGSLVLARAELESYAGSDLMDADAMLDLAEVRWRTGDLAGGGEAAHSVLARGREDALALAIAAEAVAALGRPAEARRLAGRALAASGGRVAPLFAGMPRSLIWPVDAATTPDLEVVDRGERDIPQPRRAHQADPIATGHDDAQPASPAAAEAFAGGLAALGGGNATIAALRLGVALRLEPGFAAAVLEAIGDRATDPHLALVAGDAHRLLGRESDALAAFDRARGRPDDRDGLTDGETAG